MSDVVKIVEIVCGTVAFFGFLYFIYKTFEV